MICLRKSLFNRALARMLYRHMSTARFIYVSGPDDYLALRLARQTWAEMSADVEDDFSKEIISGHAGKVEDVEQLVNRFREATQTLGLFGGRRVVWLKGCTFLADNQTGRAEGTQQACEDLREILETVVPEEVGVLISASPVDRRKRFPKWLEKEGEYMVAGGVDSKGKGVETLIAIVMDECEALGVTIGNQALEILINKVNSNSRLVLEETRKLATYLGDEGSEITAKLIEEIVPNFGEGDFFESTEAFFSRNLRWTLDALRRHFFAGHDARPVIASLQNRNRLLIQLKALSDGGEIQLGGRGIAKPGFERAASKYSDRYNGISDKSGYNVFTQNLWYMGKLIGEGKMPSLKRLIDHQQEFIRAFEEIVERPNEQEEALRSMAIRCLA
jgi:DNA polymerase-3 subunit delta